MKEIDLVPPIIAFLSEAGYEVYQEVQSIRYGPTIDIVSKLGQILWAIELKTSLSLHVLGQAWRNRGYFHYSSVAIPGGKRRETIGVQYAYHVAQRDGIGILRVRGMNDINEVSKPHFNRRAATRWVHLCEAQKTFAQAGNDRAKKWTPFQATKQELIRYVREHPGCKLGEAMQHIRHHYSSMGSATSAIRQWVEAHVIKEIYLDWGRLYPSSGWELSNG